MKNLVASIVVTIILAINSIFAISLAVVDYEVALRNAIFQTMWLLLSLGWLLWSINRYCKLRQNAKVDAD